MAGLSPWELPGLQAREGSWQRSVPLRCVPIALRQLRWIVTVGRAPATVQQYTCHAAGCRPGSWRSGQRDCINVQSDSARLGFNLASASAQQCTCDAEAYRLSSWRSGHHHCIDVLVTRQGNAAGGATHRLLALSGPSVVLQ
jgi:hypothetical protein